jgi:ubiquinone/menaquinone biosynthesis C-methylase UbiE
MPESCKIQVATLSGSQMKLNWVERHYVNSPIRYSVQRLVVQWFKSTMPIAPGANLLEVGCGRGAGARLILSKFQPRHLQLLDIDLTMIETASKYLSVEKNRPISFCAGDAAYLPFATAHFDAVFGFGVLHHIPAWRIGLKEIARVLKPGGVYYLEEFYPGLYQNLITKRLLVHPDHDRFHSKDLYEASSASDLILTYTLELKKLGILGIAIRQEVGGSSRHTPDYSR